MNFLLLGYGSIGKRHTNILRAMGHHVTTVDPDPKAGANHLGIPKYITGPEQVKLTPEYNGIIDCTPPDVRAGWAIQHRAHFIEKPLGVEMPYYQYCVKDKVVMMGFTYRWCFTLEAFVAYLRQHTIYSLIIIGGQHLQDWHAEDYHERSYHGVVLDSLPHSLYVARWICGELEYIGSVCSGGAFDIDVEDTAGVFLRGENETPVYCLADYLRRPRGFYIEAVTSDGVKRWELQRHDIEAMYWRQMTEWCMLANGTHTGDYPTLADGKAVQEVLDEIRA